jgi:hypothetical protein
MIGRESREPVARAAARGLVAAMAMTGTRRVTQNLGLLGPSPPEAIVGETLPPTSRLSAETREVVIELAHWCYGAAAGAAFGLLPDRMRRHIAAGPAYGLGIWLLFELGVAPALGVQYAEERKPAGRLMLALDHLLYGIVVAGRLAPERRRGLRLPQPPLLRQVLTHAAVGVG